MKKKLLFIGSIDDKYNPGGETFKNQLFCDYFEKSNIIVKKVDIEAYKSKNILMILEVSIKILFAFIFPYPNKIVLSKSTGGAFCILKLSKYLNIFNKEIYYIVTGGSMVDMLQQKKYNKSYLHQTKIIFLQSRIMQKKLIQLGDFNTRYMPNTKKVFQISPKQKNIQFPIQLVFLSRVTKQKGMTLLLDALDDLNENETMFTLDVYGPFEDAKYKAYYENRTGGNEFINYKGFLDLNTRKGYESLSNYDLFVFPTFWEGEGFPGVVLDAMIARLPILASDWNYNSEVVNSDIGYLFASNDLESLKKNLLHISQNISDLIKKSNLCFDFVQQYDSEKVLKKLVHVIFK